MVYLIVCQDEAICKIGFTRNDAKTRLRQLQTSTHYELQIHTVIEGDEQDEREIHNKFMHLHKRREWFNLTDEIVEYFAMVYKDQQNKFDKPVISFAVNKHTYAEHGHERLTALAKFGASLAYYDDNQLRAIKRFTELAFPSFGKPEQAVVDMVNRAWELKEHAAQLTSLLDEAIDSNGQGLNYDGSIPTEQEEEIDLTLCALQSQ